MTREVAKYTPQLQRQLTFPLGHTVYPAQHMKYIWSFYRSYTAAVFSGRPIASPWGIPPPGIMPLLLKLVQHISSKSGCLAAKGAVCPVVCIHELSPNCSSFIILFGDPKKHSSSLRLQKSGKLFCRKSTDHFLSKTRKTEKGLQPNQGRIKKRSLYISLMTIEILSIKFHSNVTVNHDLLLGTVVSNTLKCVLCPFCLHIRTEDVLYLNQHFHFLQSEVNNQLKKQTAVLHLKSGMFYLQTAKTCAE